MQILLEQETELQLMFPASTTVRPSLLIMPKETGNQGSFEDPRPLIRSSVIFAGPLTETKNFQN